MQLSRSKKVRQLSNRDKFRQLSSKKKIRQPNGNKKKIGSYLEEEKKEKTEAAVQQNTKTKNIHKYPKKKKKYHI